MFRTVDPCYEHLGDEDEDLNEVQLADDTEVVESVEDPEEVQTAEDTEVMVEESDDEDPEEIQAMSDVRVMEEDTDLTTEQVMKAVTEQAVDEGTEGDIDEPVDDAIGSSGLRLPPFPAERAPTPPPLPLSPFYEEFEELTPEPQQTEDAPPAEPSTPPHVPIEGIPVCVHNWVVDRLHEDLAVAEARLAESRAELAAERDARLGCLRGGSCVRAREMHRAVTRIELRARMRVRALPTDGDGRVSQIDTEKIFRIAMSRIRALGHAGG